MDQQGKLRQEVVDAIGNMLKLDAVLSMGEHFIIHFMCIYIPETYKGGEMVTGSESRNRKTG